MTSCVVLSERSDQPRQSRLKASATTATYAMPCQVATWQKSAIHSWSGAEG